MFFMHALNVYIYILCIGAFANCSPDDPMNTYLFVQGVFNLVQLVLCTLWSLACVAVRDIEESSSILSTIYMALLTAFLLTWTVAWTTWLSVSMDGWKDSHLGCGVLYTSAIVSLSLHWVIVLLLFMFLLVYM